MRFTRLNESDEYRRQREELRVAEVDLIDHIERVAALRRGLTADTVVDDYELVEVSNGDPRAAFRLFSAPDRALKDPDDVGQFVLYLVGLPTNGTTGQRFELDRNR